MVDAECNKARPRIENVRLDHLVRRGRGDTLHRAEMGEEGGMRGGLDGGLGGGAKSVAGPGQVEARAGISSTLSC